MSQEKALNEDKLLVVYLFGAAVILGGALLIFGGAWLRSKQWPSMPNPNVEVQTKQLRGFNGISAPYTTIIDRKTGQRSPLIVQTR
jgi:hypothetical protein